MQVACRQTGCKVCFLATSNHNFCHRHASCAVTVGDLIVWHPYLCETCNQLLSSQYEETQVGIACICLEWSFVQEVVHYLTYRESWGSIVRQVDLQLFYFCVFRCPEKLVKMILTYSSVGSPVSKVMCQRTAHTSYWRNIGNIYFLIRIWGLRSQRM